MAGEFSRLTSEMAQTGEVKRRRDSSTQLRNMGFAQRRSLEKRGTLAQPAESKLTAQQLDSLHVGLNADDRSVRLNAITIAGDLGGATSVRALQANCEAGDLDIRLAAISSLGDIGGIESTSILTRLASDSGEDAEVRFAALTALEELAAKRITSGPDRRFDPAGDPSTTAGAVDKPNEFTQTSEALVRELCAIESDSSADDLLRLKAADIRGYLESGVT
ncbi:HEAT repeat domain-containing protein [Streptomyces sp. NPDC059153]|uniref:HEAT repeat domain-containing protein n=1 Tax=Streptomyces sp. NPDC059153 TaxID=3346743 RepID=UPI0036B8AA94